MIIYSGPRLLVTWEGWKWFFKPLYCSRLGAKAAMLFGIQIAWRDR